MSSKEIATAGSCSGLIERYRDRLPFTDGMQLISLEALLSPAESNK